MERKKKKTKTEILNQAHVVHASHLGVPSFFFFFWQEVGEVALLVLTCGSLVGIGKHREDWLCCWVG